MKKFDQKPYKLPPSAPAHVPAEMSKRPLEEQSIMYFSKRRYKLRITPVIRLVSRPSQPELQPEQPMQIPESETPVPEPQPELLMQIPEKTVHFPEAPPVHIPELAQIHFPELDTLEPILTDDASFN
ncbi:hypothetical protein TNCV_4467321 [Trichonephila clavipes]|nr:hypothetical protein TNCV_4467321 [Trichonephila clavipes]